MSNLCKCGCGFFVSGSNDYVHGHNRRGLASYTSGNKWSMYHYKCAECGTIEIPHAGKGLCVSCYKKYLYNLDKIKWSRNYKRCRKCGTTERPHSANGLCGTCYANKLNRKKGIPKRNIGAWSWYYKKCKKCGTTKRHHSGHGLCVDCLETSKRDLSNAVECPVCSVKVNNLNQHLAMRAKKCNTHKKYQYDRFKIYFDSDLNLDDISKELNMERHSVTRQFITYFGEEETRKRNEIVRRCNISEKAIINKNYKNMYGTLVEYESPNQGVITLRSKIEVVFADTLKNKSWWYERDSFPYLDREGKRHTYTPDFYIEEDDVYIEVKGNNLVDEDVLYKIDWINKNTDKRIELKVL